MSVAPYTGAWIETQLAEKYVDLENVAPYTGAWIETSQALANGKKASRRTLHGCVD